MSDIANVINETDARRWVSEIERFDEEILSIKMENASRQKAMKERKAEAFERADAAGVPSAALKLELFRRDLERKRKAKEADAGVDKVELADMIRAALGDFAGLPLGGAAVAAAKDFVDGVNASGLTVTMTADGKSVTVGGKRGRPKKGAAPLVGNDTGAPPMTGADDEADLRSTRQREQEAARVSENQERLKGIKPLDGSSGVH
jgi:hypothetical protein